MCLNAEWASGAVFRFMNSYCALIDWHVTLWHLGLASAFLCLSGLIGLGALRWLHHLAQRSDFDSVELKPRQDAVVTGAGFALATVAGLYAAAEASAIFAHTHNSGLFVLILVSLAALPGGHLSVSSLPSQELQLAKQLRFGMPNPLPTHQSQTRLSSQVRASTRLPIGSPKSSSGSVSSRLKNFTVNLKPLPNS